MDITIKWSDKLKALPSCAVFKDFTQKMANRLLVGFIRYGPPKVEKHYMTRMIMEVKAYKRTGNVEHLYNVANYALLEICAPEHPRHHFDGSVDSATRGKMGI
jgi:hypothetical protein